MAGVTLAQAYYALAAFLLLAGWLIVTDSPVLRTFRRSKGATVILALVAIAWFAWWLLNIPEADLAGLPRMPGEEEHNHPEGAHRQKIRHINKRQQAEADETHNHRHTR